MPDFWPKTADGTINWDRVFSLTALVISIVTAGATVWQARIAQRALRISEEQPQLHIIDTSILTEGAHRHGLKLTIKNEGKLVAYTVVGFIDKMSVQNRLRSNPHPGTTTVMERGPLHLIAGQLAPGQSDFQNVEIRTYAHGDVPVTSGHFEYVDQVGNPFTLPWCYEFTAFDGQDKEDKLFVKEGAINCLGKYRVIPPK
jgi:hypothetical protein